MNTALFARRHTTREHEATQRRRRRRDRQLSLGVHTYHRVQMLDCVIQIEQRERERAREKQLQFISTSAHMTVHSRSLVQLSTGDLYISIDIVCIYREIDQSCFY